MITPAGNLRIFLVTEPVDFRKGMDGLVAHVANLFGHDPYDGSIYVFRSRRADRLKLIVWDGTGTILLTKRLDGSRFVWPKPHPDGTTLTRVQFDALFEGIDWRNLSATTARKPSFI